MPNQTPEPEKTEDTLEKEKAADLERRRRAAFQRAEERGHGYY